MSEFRDRANELLAAGAYRKYVLDRYALLREAAANAFVEDGITEQRIVAKDGTYLGMISVADEAITVVVDDEDAMLDYMMHEHPGELVEVTSYHINPAFWSKIVTASKKARTGVDPTRQNEPLAWVKVVVSPGEIRVTPSSAARERVHEIVERQGITRLELEP